MIFLVSPLSIILRLTLSNQYINPFYYGIVIFVDVLVMLFFLYFIKWLTKKNTIRNALKEWLKGKRREQSYILDNLGIGKEEKKKDFSWEEYWKSRKK